MGRLRREGAGQGLLPGPPAGGAQRPPGDGDRHRRVHGHARGPSPSSGTGCNPAQAMSSSPAQRAEWAASRWRCCRGSDYRVVASTGRPEQRDYLTELGAADLIDRATLAAKPTRPLDSERWAGAIDVVGGTTLATILTQLKYRGERRRLRSRRRQRPAGDCDPVPAARGQFARHRFGDVSSRRADRSMATPGRATCRSTSSIGSPRPCPLAPCPKLAPENPQRRGPRSYWSSTSALDLSGGSGHRFRKAGLRFSIKAAMPSLRSSVAKVEWNSPDRSKRTPSARVVS